MDNAKCYEVVRELRWPDRARSAGCRSDQVTKRTFHDRFYLERLSDSGSSRMGTNKSLVMLNGKPLIQNVIERLDPLNTPIHLITNRPDDYHMLDLATLPDMISGKGALGDLYSTLIHSTANHTLCVACDIPFLNANLLSYLVSLRESYDPVAPRIDGRVETLHHARQLPPQQQDFQILFPLGPSSQQHALDQDREALHEHHRRYSSHLPVTTGYTPCKSASASERLPEAFLGIEGGYLQHKHKFLS
jgi:hypothetical protein